MSKPDSVRVFLEQKVERLRQSRQVKRIVFPEGNDPRVLEAAERLAAEGLIEPILLGKSASGGLRAEDPETSPKARNYAGIFLERRRAKGVTDSEASAMVRHPLYFGNLMVAAGDADGFVGGALYTSRETIGAMLRTIGLCPGVQTLSSSFIMAVPDTSFGHNGLMVFADCSIVIRPTSVQLADIAIASAGTMRNIVGAEPKVAMLTFSTKGSGRHAEVDRVVEALRVVKAKAPDLDVDGEMQADTALVPAIASSKAPGSTVGGKANTLIFPDLASANIGYKLVERIAGGAALGPFLQGLAKPANELSRGCSADDIYAVAVITALEALENERHGY